jgi:hypothetical protein
MKITKSQLKRIVKEELESTIQEQKDLKEAYESYEMVPGSGEEGVSGLVDPLQSMESEEELERQASEEEAAARKQKALIWKLMQDEGEVDPTARFKPKSKTRSSEGNIQREDEFGDTYAKLYNLYSGEDIGQPGDATRLPDAFAERRPRGSREDFIKKPSRVTKAALEEMIREEIEATLAESDAMKKKTIKSAWESYCDGMGLHPTDQYTGKNLPTPDWLDVKDCNKRRAHARTDKEGAIKRK